MPFSNLGLAEPFVRAVVERGYAEPTPVQIQAIPAVLSGGDLLAGAQTGTGKTAGFVLPLLQLLSTRAPTHAAGAAARKPIRALILTPTRELAAQVEESVREYGKYMRLTSMVMFGGVNINPQIDRLRRGVDILVATPGRLLDHAQQRTRRSVPRRDPGAGRSRPDARHGLHPRHQAGACAVAQGAPEPAVLGHVLRRDQGAGRRAAQPPGDDRGGVPHRDRRPHQAAGDPRRPRTEARAPRPSHPASTAGSRCWCSCGPSTAPTSSPSS